VPRALPPSRAAQHWRQNAELHVLFRCQRLTRLQGHACGQLAGAILLHLPFNTRKRMSQWMAGTLLGLVVGWALFDLFPSLLLQSMFAVVATLPIMASQLLANDCKETLNA